MSTELPRATYWIVPGRLLAGAYPGGRNLASTVARLEALRGLGVDYYVDLTWPGELSPYEQLLPNPYEAADDRPVQYTRRPIRDHGLPASPLQTAEILDEIDEALGLGHCVYVHCRAGIGRTGLVVGCHLARQMGDGEAALERLDELWQASERYLEFPHTPETPEQAAYIRGWPAQDPRADGRAAAGAAQPPSPLEDEALAVASRLQDRYRGLVAGLALGDALGQPAQHRRAGTFTPVADLIGGGPHELPPGAWTDDTAVPLLLAEGLLEHGTFDARDQLERLRRWQTAGHLSATGQCLGITAGTARALAQAQWSGNPYSGSHDPARAEQEPLARAGVAAAWALPDLGLALATAVDSCRLTHQAPVVLDAVRYYTALLFGALRGAPKADLLAPHYEPEPGLWQRLPLKPEVAAVAAGSWRDARPPVSSGRAVDGLAIALWALAHGQSFRDTVLRAVNLGGEADSTAAIAGQLAGAVYGAATLPTGWLAVLCSRERLEATADRLLAAAIERPSAA